MANTIKSCWNHVKILSDTIPKDIYNDDLMFDDDFMLDDELNEVIRALHLPNMMQVKEFLAISEEDIIYEIPNISEFVNMFKDRYDPDEIDDSAEVCINEALQSLKTLNLYLLQQEN